jgi:hypothetical protein
MSHFPEVTRPAMPRRKSSAQNLLSSFKSATSSSQSVNTIPAILSPTQTGPGTISSVTGMSIASALQSVNPPTVSTPIVRGDSADGSALYAASIAGAASPPLGSSTSVESLRDLLQKRLVTLTYIRNVFEGYVFRYTIGKCPYIDARLLSNLQSKLLVSYSSYQPRRTGEGVQ